MFASIGRLVAAVARHALPVGGVFAADWHPVTAIAVYWVESLLMALGAAALSAIIHRRLSAEVIDEARKSGDAELARTLGSERGDLLAASITPRDVLLFHGGSMLFFGVFLSMVMLILIGNGRIPEPVRWGELRDGATAMLLIAALSFSLDLWSLDRLRAAGVAARVNDCLARWALFWLLGFFGTLAMMVSGRPEIFFGFFAVLKIWFESWARLARFFGWRSLKDRQAEARAGS
jgi:hypothetical protein